MLFFAKKGDFAFVKVAQNFLKSGISPSAIGCLSILEFIKTNPRQAFTMEYINRSLRPYAHASKALEELEAAGYFTKHCYPTGQVNTFSWKLEVNSFIQNTGSFGVVYYDAKGNATKGGNLRVVRKVEESDFFLCIPKSLLLNKKISLSGKGLYALLLGLSKKDYSKEEIRKELSMKSYEFKKAWQELLHAGYLSVQKSDHRKYDFILTPLPAENMQDAKAGHKKELFKIQTNTFPSNIRDEQASMNSFSDLAGAVIINKPLEKSISKVLFSNHSNEKVERFNEELTRFLGSDLTKYMDYKTLLTKYRDACSVLSVKVDIRSLGGYIHTILVKSFAPEKKRVGFDYSMRTKESLVSEWESAGKEKPQKPFRPGSHGYQKTTYDFDALNAFLLAN